jgi:hypothetical protein
MVKRKGKIEIGKNYEGRKEDKKRKRSWKG